MNYLDYIIVAVVSIFTVRGLFRGFFYEVFGLLSIIVSLILATKFMSNVSGFLDRIFDLPPTVLTLMGFTVTFIACMLVFQAVTHFLHKMAKATFLSWLEKLAGAAVGFLKGGIIISLLVWLIAILPFASQLVPGQKESVLFKPARNFAPRVFDIAMKIVPNSKSFYAELKETFDRLAAVDVGSQTREYLHSLEQDSDRSDDKSR